MKSCDMKAIFAFRNYKLAIGYDFKTWLCGIYICPIDKAYAIHFLCLFIELIKK